MSKKKSGDLAIDDVVDDVVDVVSDDPDEIELDVPAWAAGLTGPRKKFRIYTSAEYVEWAQARARFDQLSAQIIERNDDEGATLADEDDLLAELEELRDTIAELSTAVKCTEQVITVEDHLSDKRKRKINAEAFKSLRDESDDEVSAHDLSHEFLLRLLAECATDADGNRLTRDGWDRVRTGIGAQWEWFANDVSAFLMQGPVKPDFSLPDLPTSRA